MEGFGGDWHFKPGFVYIAGSLTGRAIKIGRTIYIRPQQKKLRNQKYGGFADWVILSYVWVDEAGRIEANARRQLARYKFRRRYIKNGLPQMTKEMVRCSYSLAQKAVSNLLTDEQSYKVYTLGPSRDYDFQAVVNTKK